MYSVALLFKKQENSEHCAENLTTQLSGKLQFLLRPLVTGVKNSPIPFDLKGIPLKGKNLKALEIMWTAGVKNSISPLPAPAIITTVLLVV